MSHDLVLMLSVGRSRRPARPRHCDCRRWSASCVAGFVLAGLGVEGSATLDSLAELGVLLLLFAIGLKFDVRVLARREVLGVGVAPRARAAPHWPLGLLAGARSARRGACSRDADGTDLVLVALALSFSSTVVAVKLLEEQNATRSLHGRTTIGILVVQDLVAVARAGRAWRARRRSWWAPALLLLVPAAWLAACACSRSSTTASSCR